MSNFAAIVMVLAMGLLMIASFAPALGISLFDAPRYLSGGLGVTGLVLLVIAAVGGMLYIVGRQK